MIFKIEKGKDIFESNPELKNFEFMGACTSRDLKYIFWTYDYKSPLKGIPIEDRKVTACKMAGFLMEQESGRPDKNARNVINGKTDRVNCAITEFMGLQFDEEYELLLGYTEEIAQGLDLMKKKDKSEKEWQIVTKINSLLPNLLSAKKDLEKKLGLREERSREEDTDSLSTLDLMHEDD